MASLGTQAISGQATCWHGVGVIFGHTLFTDFAKNWYLILHQGVFLYKRPHTHQLRAQEAAYQHSFDVLV